jgi:hypothetical protein
MAQAHRISEDGNHPPAAVAPARILPGIVDPCSRDDRADGCRRDERGGHGGAGMLIFAEKLRRYGAPFGQSRRVVLVTVGVVAIWFPWLLPGLHVSAMRAM